MARLFLVLSALLAGLLPILPAQPLLPPKGPEDPIFSPVDEKLLAGFLLDTGKLNRFSAATKALATKAKDDVELQKELDEDEEKQDGIDRWIEIVSTRKPKTMAVLKSVSADPREFVLSGYAIMLAMVHADLLKANPLSPLPPYVPRANLGFVRSHEDILTKLFQAIEAIEDPGASNSEPGATVAPTPVPSHTPDPKRAEEKDKRSAEPESTPVKPADPKVS